MKWDTYHTNDITEKFVYRYLSFEKLVSFLRSNSLYLSRLDKFEDHIEGVSPFYINEIILGLKAAVKPKNPNPNISKQVWDEIIENHKKAVNHYRLNLIKEQKERFVSCWILGDVESLGMWDLYARNGFAIRFERKYFQKLIRENLTNQVDETAKIDLLVAGKVIYQNFDKMMFNELKSGMKYSVFRKHLSFKHENEYRIVDFKPNTTDDVGIKFKLPKLENLDFDIIANPGPLDEQ